VDPDVVLWVVARSSGVACLLALSIAILTGMAMRSGALTWLSHNRGIRVLHDFTNWLWIPLGALHVAALVADHTAKIGLLDLVIPFGVSYGRFEIGLGTFSLIILTIVVVTTWLRRWMPYGDWLTLHRLSYIGFVALFAHSLLSGTDLADPRLATLLWTTAVLLGLVGLARLVSVVGEDARGA
jgi:methionine sulfoxide reductase heme-binding subunit